MKSNQNDSISAVKTIFLNAVENSPSERKAFVRLACEGDRDTEQKVLELLSSYEKGAETILDNPHAFPAILSLSKGICSPNIVTRGSRTGEPSSYLLVGEDRVDRWGTIYNGIQLSPHRRTVAICLFHEGIPPERVDVLMKSSCTAATLRHGVVGAVLDAGTCEQHGAFVVLEPLDGMSVTSFSNEKQLSFSERIKLFEDVCCALGRVHQEGCVHGALAPASLIVVATEGSLSIKILHLGFEEAMQDAPPRDTTQKQMAYKAPETATEDRSTLTPASDIYSMGSILFELLVGRPPRAIPPGQRRPSAHFNKAHGLNMGANSRFQCWKIRRQLRQIDATVEKCMTEDPKSRYPTIEHLLRDIRRVRSDSIRRGINFKKANVPTLDMLESNSHKVSNS